MLNKILQLTKSQNTLTFMILIGILTAFGSEIKIMPFGEAPFRFGLGSIIFFLSILIRPVPIFTTGLITACIIWLFRTGVSFTLYDYEATLYEHLPATLFYIAFAAGLHLINIQKLRTKPFKLGLYAATIEIFSNIIEQSVMTLIVTHETLDAKDYLLFIAVAILRSYFVVGLFSTLAMAEQQKRTEQLLAIGADLYVETLYIQKSMDNIERITGDSFILYQQLKEIDPALSLKALMLSQEIHEMKKDAERIYAGLSKIVTTKQEESYELADLLNMVIEGNTKYADTLSKSIRFDVTSDSLRIKEPILLLAILNNIISNGIEAIEQSGWIRLEIITTSDTIVFTIENNGPPIPPNALPVIFDPGFTTKFSTNGYASTGIGLSHVKSIVQRLEGTIHVKSGHTTVFDVHIPTYKLQ